MLPVFVLAFLVVLSCCGGDFARAESKTAGTPHIEWEVKSRFRLFGSEADFQRHVDAMRGDGVLAAERLLAKDSDGRGWARDIVERLCVDRAGCNHFHHADFRLADLFNVGLFEMGERTETAYAVEHGFSLRQRLVNWRVNAIAGPLDVTRTPSQYGWESCASAVLSSHGGRTGSARRCPG